MILINALVFGSIAIILVTGLVSWGGVILKSSRLIVGREQAFHIAEAGVDYYRWHLAHAVTDYYDGNASTTSPGPYVHTFADKDGNIIGEYALTITPPPSGSTVVKIKSRGTFYGVDPISRTILATLAIPSLAKYSVAANDVMRFGSAILLIVKVVSRAVNSTNSLAGMTWLSLCNQLLAPVSNTAF